MLLLEGTYVFLYIVFNANSKGILSSFSRYAAESISGFFNPSHCIFRHHGLSSILLSTMPNLLL